MVLEGMAVGSFIDLTTLIYILVEVRHGRIAELRDLAESARAGLVAAARRDPSLDDDRLQADLEVADRDVNQYLVHQRSDD